MGSINSITVYCSTAEGRRPEYVQAAVETGKVLAKRGIRLVYGGSAAGMAGAMANAALAAGGVVAGVMPRFLYEQGKALQGLSELHVAADLHAHKALFAELSGGFMALPGGLGTLEEFFEILTWAQLGLHHKPCGFLNIAGYYDGLLGFLDQMQAEGFISPAARALAHAESGVDALLDWMEAGA
jgi:uncharacterized protein (TIGR00730 family)